MLCLLWFAAGVNASSAFGLLFVGNEAMAAGVAAAAVVAAGCGTYEYHHQVATPGSSRALRRLRRWTRVALFGWST